jgi:hypothetical protein
MARIDIASIPNAPAIAAPSLQSAEPVIQGMSRLRQESMPLDAFSGEARGMQAIGQGVGQLATPLNQFADAMSRAKTLSDMAQVDKVKMEHTGFLKDALLTAPADQYEKIYQDSIPEMQKKLDALNISPDAKSKASPDMVRYIAETGVMVRSAKRKQEVSDMRGNVLNAAQEDITSGNYYGAIDRIKKGTGTLFSETEADSHILKIQEEQKKTGWQQAINADPQAALQTLQADLKTGKSETFVGANPIELSRLTETARAEVNRQRIDATRTLENQIDSGEITDSEQLKKAAGTTLDDVSLKALQNRMKNTMGPSPDTWLRIQNDIDNLDPKGPKDPGYQDFQTKWLAIKSDVNQNVGTQWRGSMESQLYQKIQRSASGKGLTIDEKIQNAGFSRINSLYENGAFGQFNVKKDATTGMVNPAELGKQTDAYGKMMDFKDSLLEAIKQGKVPNTNQGINTWINDQLTDAQKKVIGKGLTQPAATGFFDNWLNNFKQGMGENPSLTPNDVRSKITTPKAAPGELPAGAIPAPKGSKITNYWPTEVKNKDGTIAKDGVIGNHENQLQAGDFAASPDVQEHLQSQGAKTGDPIRIYLADGEHIDAKFNDSTSQDSRRKAEGKAPLRGRWDIWTATKGHKKDGVAVIGYQLLTKNS